MIPTVNRWHSPDNLVGGSTGIGDEPYNRLKFWNSLRSRPTTAINDTDNAYTDRFPPMRYSRGQDHVGTALDPGTASTSGTPFDLLLRLSRPSLQKRGYVLSPQESRKVSFS